jgi:hypothetical protein
MSSCDISSMVLDVKFSDMISAASLVYSALPGVRADCRPHCLAGLRELGQAMPVRRDPLMRGNGGAMQGHIVFAPAR